MYVSGGINLFPILEISDSLQLQLLDIKTSYGAVGLTFWAGPRTSDRVPMLVLLLLLLQMLVLLLLLLLPHH